MTIASRLSEISSITENKYGFTVDDWDQNRSGMLVGKVEINADPSYINSGYADSTIILTPSTSSSNKLVALAFKKIFDNYQNVSIDDKSFSADILHLKGLDFLFICGHENKLRIIKDSSTKE